MIIAREWTLAYLCNALWQIPLLWLVAALLAPLVRKIGVQAEHRVWVLALLASACVPACSFPLTFPIAGSGELARVTATMSAASGLHGTALRGLPGWAMDTAYVAYLLCLLIGLVRFASALRQLTGVARRAEPLVLPAELQARWRTVIAAYGSIRSARLAGSREVASPVAFGLWTPTVLLPVGLMEHFGPEQISPEQVGLRQAVPGNLAQELSAALAHEAAHLARRDFAKHIGYTLMTLPVMMHPVTWLLRARVAESREMVCDALAAGTSGGAERYAGALLRLAARLPGLPAAQNIHAIGMFDANTLERRVLRMMKQREPLRGLRRVGVYVFAGALGVAACSSALALHIRVGDVAAADAGGPVYSPGGEVTSPKVTYSVDPSFPKTAGKAPGGVCVLKLIVNTQGQPKSVHVVRSLRPDFDAEALKAVKQYRFHPATRKGEPVAVAINIEVNFQRF